MYDLQDVACFDSMLDAISAVMLATQQPWSDQADPTCNLLNVEISTDRVAAGLAC